MVKKLSYTAALLFLSIFTISLQAQEWKLMEDPPFHKHHSNGFGIDGIAYVMEGVYRNDGPNDASAEVWTFNPDGQEWTRIGDFPGPDRGLAIGDDWEGKYYYGFGARGDFETLSDLWVFDPADSSWTELASCPCIGRTHPALIAHNGKVFMGSGSSRGGDLNDWWIYDMASDTWTEGPRMPGVVRHHPFQFGIDEYVYVGGGHRFDWLRYDDATSSWSDINALPEGRVAGSQFSYENHGYLLGGDDRFHVHLPDEETFMRYDPATDEWESLPSLPNGSRWANSSFIIGSELFFFGGLDDDNLRDSSMWMIDLALLDVMTSTRDLEEASASLRLSPNPASDFFTIDHDLDWEVADVLMESIDGKFQTLISDHTLSQPISLSDLPSGLYLVQLQRDGASVNRKLMVVR